MNLDILERYRDLVDDYDAFRMAHEKPLPTVVRANILRVSAKELAELLRQEGLDGTPLAWNPEALRLAPGSSPGKSLLVPMGLFHIQEEVSLLPVVLLDPQPGETLLDLCSAPGNKTVQAALRMSDQGSILANDISRTRLGLVVRAAERLGVTICATIAGDGANLPAGIGPFDRVLADVPCSCEGTARKNPEILRRAKMVRPIRSQVALLHKAIQRCRPGGRIVYSTCTYAPEENELVVDTVLRATANDSDQPRYDLDVLPAGMDGLRTVPGLTRWQDRELDPRLANAMRVYPHHNDTGGFFVAVLEKRG